MSTSEEKYQKLATEYARLKSQIPVLKKAYLDEQSSHNQLKETVKEKEQSLRKYEQEVDSLTFRNQQLFRRCEVLQNELSTLESQKKKNKTKDSPAHSNPPVSPGIFSEELQNKIEENARLHKQVQESENSYRSKIQELEQKLEHFERECNQHETVLNTTVQKNKSLIEKLQEEKAMQEVKIQTLENEMKSFRSRTEKAENLLDSVESNLKHQLSHASKIIADKLPFIDTNNKELNGLNLPTHDRRHQLRSRELVNQSANHLAQLVQGLSNFFTYTEQRSQIYPADGKVEPISPVNVQFCKFLHENVSYLRPVEQSLREFLASFKDDSLTTLETATGLQPFAKSVKRMVAYMNKLLPYQLTSIEEECAVSSCTSTLQTKNMDLHKSLKRLNSVFNKLDTITGLLAAQSTKYGHSPSHHPKMFAILCADLSDLHDAVREVSKHYNSKVSLEHQLPTATQKLKTTDECVVSSLISLVTCTGKFSTFMSGNLSFFEHRAGYRTRGSSIGADPTVDPVRSNPAIVQFRQKATHYIAALSRPCPESVPHKVAVQNRKVLLSSAESKEGLAKQITTFQQKINKLEQEREHWMLELQLLKIKYENEIQKTKKLEKELEQTTNNHPVTSIVDNIEAPVTQRKGTDSDLRLDTTMLGKIDTVQSPTKDIDSREVLIKNHFSTRINELTLQLQTADSKTVSFHAEVRALHKQLQIAERAKCQAEDDLKALSQTYAQLKDELSTTSKSYEGQLSMMSDHLAGMNEKLTQQKDEIDDLKTQIANTSKSSSSKLLSKKSRR